MWKHVSSETCRTTTDVHNADDGDGRAARIEFTEADLADEFANGAKPRPDVKINQIEGGSYDGKLERADGEDESSAGKRPRIEDARTRAGDGAVA